MTRTGEGGTGFGATRGAILVLNASETFLGELEPAKEELVIFFEWKFFEKAKTDMGTKGMQNVEDLFPFKYQQIKLAKRHDIYEA